MKTGKYIKGNGTVWYKDEMIHRDDGPAIIYPSGYQAWWNYGKLHREDGPARTWTKEWMKNECKFHSSIPYRPNGHQEWWLNEKQINIRCVLLSLLIQPIREII